MRPSWTDANRWRTPAVLCSLIVLLAVAVSASPVRATDEAKLIRVADVPLPRPNPLRAAEPVDPIAALLAGVSERLTFEDSDSPAAAYSPVSTASAQTAPPANKVDLNTVGLRYALKFLDDGDPAAATAAAYLLPNKVDIKVVDWLIAISGRDDVPASRIVEVWRKLADWPGQVLLQTRLEQALVRESTKPKIVIEAMGARKPVTDSGAMLLTRAYLAVGRKADAETVIRTHWREDRFDERVEARIRKEFGELLTPAEYKARTERLLYEEQNNAALRNAGYVGKGEEALAVAVVAVNASQSASKLLDALPAAQKKDPLYFYSRVRVLRRADKIEEAAKVLLSAPRDPKILDGDAWWVERRLVSRDMLDKGHAKTAYHIAAGHSAKSGAVIAEAEFHAGWYALEYLDDPKTAKKHFAKILTVSSRPLSQSRGYYWLGRAAKKAGDRSEAEANFRHAGEHPTTFYGQLALQELGATKLPILPPSEPSEATRGRFDDRELVQVIHRLDAANRGDRNDIFYRALAEELTDPAELTLLVDMAEADGGHQFALQIGKTAAYRGLQIHSLAFPTKAVPPASFKANTVEKPMVYAIARQESAFNPKAVSRAGARGLLQLMPATAKQMARSVGLPYSQGRLTSDPAYNATLGAEFLSQLYSSFDRSYVLTFAAYNAGPSRAKAWIEAYGDPRDPKVDVVNWIEHIPFTETRNYVQRIMENLQVYRARLGSPALTIASDLKRGQKG